MTPERIKQIQKQTAYPNSRGVFNAMMQVFEETMNELNELKKDRIKQIQSNTGYPNSKGVFLAMDQVSKECITPVPYEIPQPPPPIPIGTEIVRTKGEDNVGDIGIIVAMKRNLYNIKWNNRANKSLCSRDIIAPTSIPYRITDPIDRVCQYTGRLIYRDGEYQEL